MNRSKLLEAHYAGAIPLELLKSEQERIAQELESATRVVQRTVAEYQAIDATLRDCLAFLTNCHNAYLAASRQIRRRLNQAVFERILVSVDGSTEAELNGPFRALLAPDLVTAGPTIGARRHQRRDTATATGSPVSRTGSEASGT